MDPRTIPGWALLARLRELGLVDLEPWIVFEEGAAAELTRNLARRFPRRRLLAFARRQDNDDCACFDLAEPPGTVVIVHDFAGPGWEHVARFEDVRAWLRAALEEFIDFESWDQTP